jgi:predicted dehydrogenase
MIDKTIKVGLIGSGFISEEVHLPVWSKLPNVKVTAICDKDEKKLRETARRFKVPKGYSDLTEMLSQEKLDLVDICTPPDTHAALAIQTLELGSNCMVEKPMALTVADAERMIKTARERGLNLYVIHNYSFMPCIRKARSMVLKGEIGRLVSVDVKYLCSIEKERHCDESHWCYDYPGGILSTEITPHLVMLLLDFLGAQAVECIQVFKEKLSSYPHIQADELRAVVKGDGTVGTLSLSYNSPFKLLTVYLVGTDGCIYTNASSQAVVKHRPTNWGNKSATARGLESLGELYQLSAGLMTTGVNVILGRYAPMVEGHKYLMSRCYDNLVGRGEYPVDLYKSRQVVKILEEMFKET